MTLSGDLFTSHTAAGTSLPMKDFELLCNLLNVLYSQFWDTYTKNYHMVNMVFITVRVLI